MVLSAALFKKAGVQNRKRRNSDEDKTSHTSLESLSTAEKLSSISNSKCHINNRTYHLKVYKHIVHIEPYSILLIL